MANISLQSPNVIEFGSFHITNAVLAGLLETGIIIVLILLVVKKSKLIPTKLQLAFEMIITTFYDSLTAAYGSRKRAVKYLPFYVAMFLYLLLANQFSILPLVNDLVTGDGNLLFRASTADYSQPIALAIITLAMSHIIALTISPLKHIGNFIKIKPLFEVRSLTDLANACLELFLGLLDIIGELAKLISISSRLFGNIFAGEVMVVVIASIASWSAYLLPIPFLVLGIFSGLVQAYVFTVLALQFVAGTITSVEEENSKEEESVYATA